VEADAAVPLARINNLRSNGINNLCSNARHCNLDYTANYEDGDPIDFNLPETATVQELIAAIEWWITNAGT
jgi:hypothetical protein